MKKDKKKRELTDAEGADALSAAELDMLRLRVDELEDRSAIPPPERKKQNKVIKFAKNNTVATVVVSVLVISLIAALTLVGMYFAANSSGKGDYTFVYGEGAKAEKITVKYEECVIKDVLYVDMNKIAEFAQLSVSGSEESMKYIAKDGNYIKFTNDSLYAVINTTKVTLPEDQLAIVGGGKCLVPYQIVSKIVQSGISFKLDQAQRSVSIKRTTYTEDDVILNEDVTFTTADLVVAKSAVYEYDVDITNYLQYIAPEDPTPYLLLVGPSNPLAADYTPNGLEKIPSGYAGQGSDYQLVGTARSALVAMMREMYRDLSVGDHPYVTSAYRSYARQGKLFEEYVQDYMKAGYSREAAEQKVSQTSARAGQSEHQSGLCVDFILEEMKTLDNSFASSAAYRWLSENAYKFGFILRYPDGKQDILAHDYESWHYRFVGREAATEIYLSDICLEEYLEIVF